MIHGSEQSVNRIESGPGEGMVANENNNDGGEFRASVLQNGKFLFKVICFSNYVFCYIF